MMTAKTSDAEIIPTVAVGKKGVTDQVVSEIVKQLKNRKTIKIKLHGETKLGRYEVARELAKKTNARLVDVRGFTVILSRKKIRI